jgi:GDPmannose 4,6-dehydratase
MWLALQHPEPNDYVFATGRLHSVQDVVEIAFGAVGLNWKDFVKQDPRFMRPAEPQRLVGDASRARELLHWEPQTTFEQLIREMTQAEVQDLGMQNKDLEMAR